MLGVAGVADGSGRYYIDDLARELDAVVLGDHGPGGALDDVRVVRSGPGSNGTWIGAGARDLGLVGRVDAAGLHAVLSGSEPYSGRSLRYHDVTVRAFDLTFSAPKSVSLAFALCGPEVARVVLDAHDRSVASTLDYVARHASGARRTTDGERHVIPVSGLIAATFTHGVSRAHDPHLHTHAVVANLGHGEDGRWSALDGRGIYAHRRAAGALYDGALRSGITNATSWDWSRRASGACELAGVDPAVLGVFSSRHADIGAHLFERAGARRADHESSTVRSRPSPTARTIAWARTRDAKGAETPRRLRERWAGQLRSLGLPPHLEIESAERSRAPDSLDEHHFSSIVCATPHGGVTRRDALTAWATSARRGATVEDVEHCVDQLAPWGRGIGVEEASVAPAVLAPSRHSLRLLGPRPTTPVELARWRSASMVLEQYRTRWLVGSADETLGARPGSDDLSRMPARQLAAYLRMSREVTLAREALGRDEPFRDVYALGRGRDR